MADVIVDVSEIADIARRLELMTDTDNRDIADDVGGSVEEMVRERILRTKRTPDGDRWPAWSERYKATRKAHHSLLVDTRRLAESIRHRYTKLWVAIGSSLVYAPTQFFGRGKIPSRQPLGWGPDELDAAEAIVLDRLERSIVA